MGYAFDIPEIKPGEVITADWLNKLVRALRVTLLPGGFQSDAFNIQRPPFRKSSGVGDFSLLEGRFGLVVGAADPEGDGFYVGLNGDLLPVDENGDVIEGDPTGYGLPFTNLQQNCGCPEGARIVISIMTNSDEDEVVYGYCIDAMDQLSTLPGDSPGGLLGGSGSKNAQWSGETC